MAGKRKWDFIEWIEVLLSLIVAVGIGSLFVQGIFDNSTILGWIPDVIRRIVGWTLVVLAIWGFWGKLSK